MPQGCKTVLSSQACASPSLLKIAYVGTHPNVLKNAYIGTRHELGLVWLLSRKPLWLKAVAVLRLQFGGLMVPGTYRFTAP